MGNENEAVETAEDQGSTLTSLDKLIDELDGPDLEGDLPEGEVTTQEASESEEAEEEAKTESEEPQKVEETESASEGEATVAAEETEESKEEEPKPKPDPRDEEIRNLKRTTRQQEEDLRTLRKQNEAINKKLTESGLVKEDEEDPEAISSDISDAIAIKLETLAETMKMTPEYKDLDEVLTEDRYNDVIDAAVLQLVDKNGYSKDEASDIAQNFVWSKPNPYKYLYKIIKDHHPDFATKEVKEDEPKAEEKKEEKSERIKTEKKTAPSIESTPGSGSKEKGGWTASRIDDLPEDRLHEVPPDIYDKYLAGDLD